MFMCLTIGLKFYQEYLNQLNGTYCADAIRLVIFMAPAFLAYFILFLTALFSYKRYALVVFVNSMIFFVGMLSPENLPKKMLFLDGVSFLLLLILLVIELIIRFRKKVPRSLIQ
jgi:uncharacterized phage infection (PIP) family protein YhgE